MPPFSSFTAKQLRVTFRLNNSNAVFVGADGVRLGNSLQLAGLRMSAEIIGAGMPAWQSATLKIWGMAQADMNALAVQTIANGKTGYLPNTVLIEANSGNGWSAAFSGNIMIAAPDYAAAPDVPLVVAAQYALFDSVNPATPTSFPGSASVADIISVIVSKMNRSFINNGVTAITSGATYYPQAITEQLRVICRAYDIDAVFSPDDTLVTISPVGQADVTTPFVLSPSSGLVGYPTPQANGLVSVRSLYNPIFHKKSPITIRGSDAVISQGVPITYNSIANGDWIVCSITNTLEVSKPDGAWFSDMAMYPAADTANVNA